MDKNEAAPQEEKINLRGFLVGNPLTVRLGVVPAFVMYVHTFAPTHHNPTP